jgi:hypothetical protein
MKKSTWIMDCDAEGVRNICSTWMRKFDDWQQTVADANRKDLLAHLTEGYDKLEVYLKKECTDFSAEERNDIRGIIKFTEKIIVSELLLINDCKNYNLKVACYQFSCPVCGTQVKPGDNYIEDDGIATCLCVMPERKLVPLDPAAELNIKVARLEKALKHLRLQNLKMRLDFEVLIDHPDGPAARKILGRYRRMRKIREESSLSTQN